MSKYIVLYHSSIEVDVPAGRNEHFTWPASKRRQSIADFKEFSDQRSAAEFATKHNGHILIPAQINITVEDPADIPGFEDTLPALDGLSIRSKS